MGLYVPKKEKRQRIKESKKVAPYRFNVGDFVRISHLRHPFRKSYEQQYTTEIFKIKKRLRMQGFPIYKISSWDGKEIIEGSFYETDLMPVDVSNTEKLFFIEQIIKKKKINGQLHYLVKWEGYPSSMNSYVLASEVQTIA